MPEEVLHQIPLAKIDVLPTLQVREQWQPEHDPDLADLARSMAGAEGLIHPIVVVALAQASTFGRTYALITGRRRLAAAQQLSWVTITARVFPPCDLHALPVRLRLLTLAVRENVERQTLPAEDRRAVLRRLQALYEAVFPPPPKAPGADVADPALAAPASSFTRWASPLIGIPERTIRRDIRRAVLGGRRGSPRHTPPAAGAAVPDLDAPVVAQVEQVSAGMAPLTAALHTLSTALRSAPVVPDGVVVQRLRQELEALHAATGAALAALPQAPALPQDQEEAS